MHQQRAGDSSGLADAAKIAMGLCWVVLVRLGAAGYGAYKLSDRFNPPPVAGPGASVPPPVDPGAGVPGAPVPPPSVAPSPEAQVTPMDQAMQRALEPASW